MRQRKYAFSMRDRLSAFRRDVSDREYAAAVYSIYEAEVSGRRLLAPCSGVACLISRGHEGECVVPFDIAAARARRARR